MADKYSYSAVVLALHTKILLIVKPLWQISLFWYSALKMVRVSSMFDSTGTTVTAKRAKIRTFYSNINIKILYHNKA